MKNIPWLAVLRVSVGVLFAFSGFSKLIQPYENFLSMVHAYGILSGRAAVLAALVIPWLEFLCGVLLALGLWLRPALLNLWILNGLFITVILQALMRHLAIKDCGCFGDAVTLSPRQTLWLDIGIFLLFLFLYKVKKQSARLSMDNLFETS